VPTDAAQIDNLREQLATLSALQQNAAVRSTDPPRLSAEAWRGRAADAYGLAADLLADELASVVAELAHAQALARTELAHALA